MAVAALRPDGAARPLRGGELSDPAQALPPLPGRARSGATRSRARAASASSCSSTPIRSARPLSRPTPRCACSPPTRMEALGVPRGDYVVKVNSRKVLDGVMEAAWASRRYEHHKAVRVHCARSTSSTGWECDGVRALLGPGTQGRERRFHQRAQDLTEEQISAIVAVLEAKDFGSLRPILDQVTVNTGGVPDEHGGLAHLPYEDALN